MKDYSRYFKDPEGFITKVNINKDQIEVLFSDASGSKRPIFTYPLTKEKLKFFGERLEKQYKKVYEDKNNIVKNKVTFVLGMVLLFAFGSGAYCVTNQMLECMPVLIGVIGLDMAGIILNESLKNNHRRTIDTEYRCVSLQQEFDSVTEYEHNITKTISKDGQNLLRQQAELKDKGYVDSAYNIFFIDNASIDDLKEISARLKIYSALQKEVELERIYSALKNEVKKRKFEK